MNEQEQVIRRVETMERCFEALQQIVQEAPAPSRLPEVARLAAEMKTYYEGGQWLRDYEMDEQGLLPAYLKRGVLSEDGVYHLLDEIRQWMSGDEHAQI